MECCLKCCPILTPIGFDTFRIQTYAIPSEMEHSPLKVYNRYAGQHLMKRFVRPHNVLFLIGFEMHSEPIRLQMKHFATPFLAYIPRCRHVQDNISNT